VGKSYGVYTNLGNSVNFVDQDYHAQVNDRYNLTVMRQVPGGFKVDATWFMNFGRHVPHTIDLNMINPSYNYTYKAQLSTTVANPFYQYRTIDEYPGSLRNTAKVTKLSLLRPYPAYLGVSQAQTGDWRSRYQALQLRIQRTYALGASILVAYNYNHERNEAYFNDIQQYADTPFWLRASNPRHSLSVAGSYDIPAGKGRHFGAAMNPVMNGILGGWQLSGIYTFRSGDFLTFPSALVTGNPVISNPGPSKWFNTDAFSVMPSYTPRSNPYNYPDITGPIFWDLDGTISKVFPVLEKYKLEFRFEAYNLTNSLMWADPNMTVGNATFGRSTAQATGNRGREMQYTLRFIF
jgi:hypothetical protein